MVSAEVDYLGQIVESSEDNNSKSSTLLSVYDVKWSGGLTDLILSDLRIYYLPTDWTGTSDEFKEFYEYSNNFLKGIFPVAERQFNPSKSSLLTGNTSHFRNEDGKLDVQLLNKWINRSLVPLKIAHPGTDRYVATVPPGWFKEHTTIKAAGVHMDKFLDLYPNMSDMVVVEARIAPRPNALPITAHEIGHSYGLYPNCEDYDADCNKVWDRIGTIASPGIWVDKQIPIEMAAAREIYNFMGAPNNDEKYYEFWATYRDYDTLFNKVNTSSIHQELSGIVDPSQAILVDGTINVSGSMMLDNWYVLRGAELSILEVGPYTFKYIGNDGAILHEQSFQSESW